MLKRAGVLAFILTTGALLQPAAALAQERFDRGRDRVVEVRRDKPRFRQEYVEPSFRREYIEPRFTREYVVPVRRDYYDHDRFVRRDERWYRR